MVVGWTDKTGTTKPTMVVLVTGSVSRGVLGWLGGQSRGWLHPLQQDQGRTVVELTDRRGPRQILDYFNLYCRQPRSPGREQEGRSGREGGRARREKM